MRIDWIYPDSLAGSPRPGLLESLEEDAEQLRSFGFELIVNLTETPLQMGVEGRAFEIYHFPIVDMGAPTPGAMAQACQKISERLDAGTKTLVHCKAGLGRTGTLLACLLVYRGSEAEEAITEIRLTNPRFIQNATQEQFVQHFADALPGTR